MLINAVTAAMHFYLFALPPGQGLSESLVVSPLRAFGVPVLGGAILGVSMLLLAKLRPRNLVDPVEANALWRSGSRAFFKDQRAAQAIPRR